MPLLYFPLTDEQKLLSLINKNPNPTRNIGLEDLIKKYELKKSDKIIIGVIEKNEYIYEFYIFRLKGEDNLSSVTPEEIESKIEILGKQECPKEVTYPLIFDLLELNLPDGRRYLEKEPKIYNLSK